ncbi:MAG: hypothetical protein ACHQT9_03565 [Candidatus Saccharimonadales bacterium]
MTPDDKIVSTPNDNTTKTTPIKKHSEKPGVKNEDVGDISPDVGGTVAQAEPPKERTKSYLARFFVVSAVIAIGFLPTYLLAVKLININDLKDIVLTLGSIFGGPLGIIINNYFKESSDK